MTCPCTSASELSRIFDIYTGTFFGVDYVLDLRANVALF